MRRLILCLIALAATDQSNTRADEPPSPRLVIVGDSTLKNGRGDGAGGLWGWGQVIADHFDSSRIEIENRALGGRSTRTYLTEGLWQRSLERLRPGDFVLIQFGHNDGSQLFRGNRPRGSIRGNGDQTEHGVVEMTGKEETVHSFGWYLRKYIADAKAKGATPIVLSLVPRNIWREGRVVRAADDYGKWAAEAAKQGGAHFIDLNDLVARRYEAAGQETVSRDYFTPVDHTHTSKLGAEINASCVAEGIRRLESCSLRDYLRRPAREPERSSNAAAIYRFDFGPGSVAPGYTQVLSGALYSAERGYGFEPGAKVTGVADGEGDALTGDGVASARPLYFSVALPEGNYRVKATFVGQEAASRTTVKAELRRLMIEDALSRPAVPVSLEFTVNVRTPKLPDGREVRLKDREKTTESWAWDEKLTLEFNGPGATLSALEILPEPDAVTLYLAGDSTVTDQPLEPWNSWGQMLPRFFKAGVAVANHAESGESIASSLAARRFDKILSLIRPGDYLLFQFGHNDMKDSSPDALASYRSNLEQLVARTRQHGAHPVLVTSMERKAGLDGPTLGDYPQTVRDVAQQMKVPVIDLHAMSLVLYRALGDDLDSAFQDGTHHTGYGSYLLAKCVVEGIRENELPLASFIAQDVTPFDPAHPDPPTSFTIPASPRRDDVN